MQTLGLSSDPKPSDGMFKRLFWPTIENQYDVDLLGQQGFWLCMAVAVISLIALVVTGMNVYIIFAYVGSFFLGGCGVRERSIEASVLVFALYAMDQVSAVVLAHRTPSILAFVAAMLLFANIRATVLSQRWVAGGQDESEMPERMQLSVADRIANQLPWKIWPVGRFIFYPLVAILLFFSALGLVLIFMHR